MAVIQPTVVSPIRTSSPPNSPSKKTNSIVKEPEILKSSISASISPYPKDHASDGEDRACYSQKFNAMAVSDGVGSFGTPGSAILADLMTDTAIKAIDQCYDTLVTLSKRPEPMASQKFVFKCVISAVCDYASKNPHVDGGATLAFGYQIGNQYYGFRFGDSTITAFDKNGIVKQEADAEVSIYSHKPNTEDGNFELALPGQISFHETRDILIDATKGLDGHPTQASYVAENTLWKWFRDYQTDITKAPLVSDDDEAKFLDFIERCMGFQFEIRPGDVVVMGSDGLLDNLPLEDASKIIGDLSGIENPKEKSELITQNLMMETVARSNSTTEQCPFMRDLENRYKWIADNIPEASAEYRAKLTDQAFFRSGKKDDIACAVSVCYPEDPILFSAITPPMDPQQIEVFSPPELISSYSETEFSNPNLPPLEDGTEFDYMMALITWVKNPSESITSKELYEAIDHLYEYFQDLERNGQDHFARELWASKLTEGQSLFEILNQTIPQPNDNFEEIAKILDLMNSDYGDGPAL